MTEIPIDSNAITPEWLTNTFNKNNIIQRARVKGLEATSLGPGAGYIGQLFRYKLYYDLQESHAPKSMIAKFSSVDAEVRKSLHESGVYETEVRFYQEFAHDSGIPTPAHYFADIDMQSGRSLVLLEDLNIYRPIEFSHGCTLEESEIVMKKLGKFHAKWWGNPNLKTKSYLKPHDHKADYWQAKYQNWWRELSENLHKLLPEYEIPENFLKLGEKLAPHLSSMFEKMSESPFTLVHKDTHSNNLLFGNGTDTEDLMVLDWQMAGYGKGAADITHFIVASLQPDFRKQHEHYLLGLYHQTLVENGVKDYDFEHCWSDYEQAYFKNVYVIALLVSFLDTSTNEGKSLLRTLLPRVTAFCNDHLTDLEKFLP